MGYPTRHSLGRACLTLCLSLLLTQTAPCRPSQWKESPVPPLAATTPASSPAVLPQYAPLLTENPHLAGWITLPGTPLHTPVVATPWAPDYYLRRNFQGEYSLEGTPFLDGNCTLHSNHIILYGHNLGDGRMFAPLLGYRDNGFWQEHPTICFDTLYQTGVYQVVAAFAARVYRQDETDVFRYYQYGGELEEERFNAYLAQVYGAALYDTGVKARFGDQLLTLITCSYHAPHGRFVVVARKTPSPTDPQS